MYNVMTWLLKGKRKAHIFTVFLFFLIEIRESDASVTGDVNPIPNRQDGNK